jgi:hypothetical protein
VWRLQERARWSSFTNTFVVMAVVAASDTSSGWGRHQDDWEGSAWTRWIAG